MPGKSGEQTRIGLDALLRETIDALAALDAERIEEIAGLAGLAVCAGVPAGSATEGPVDWPASAAEWRRAAASHWVLGHLVGATARQLAVQRRIAGHGGGVFEYRPDSEARRTARWNAELSWPWRREPGRKS